jgi:hypothetical protein
MAKYAISAANAMLNAFESDVGPNAVMKIFAGSVPANCAAADSSGPVLATLPLGSDWMADASGGLKGKSGVWQDSGADGSGNASHYRIYASDGVTCKQQGSVGLAASGADMILDSVSFTAGQSFTVTNFSIGINV